MVRLVQLPIGLNHLHGHLPPIRWCPSGPSEARGLPTTCMVMVGRYVLQAYMWSGDQKEVEKEWYIQSQSIKILISLDIVFKINWHWEIRARQQQHTLNISRSPMEMHAYGRQTTKTITHNDTKYIYSWQQEKRSTVWRSGCSQSSLSWLRDRARSKVG